MRTFLPLAVAAALLAASFQAGAVDLKSLKKKLGNEGASSEQAAPPSDRSVLGALGSQLSLPEIGADTAGNAAGVLQYCVRHKYLDGDVATTVKNRLLSSAGLGGAAAERDEGYRSGLSGVLQGSDGRRFDLDSISGRVKDKACDYVLDNAASLI